MNEQRKILLVHRERAHNLGSGRDDRRFLRRTGRMLKKLGCSVRYTEADDLSVSGTPDLILSMNRSLEAGEALESVFPGIPCVNSSGATAMTLRSILYPLLLKSSFAFPGTEVADIEDIGEYDFPCWVKRMDYHHLHRLDVVYVDSRQTMLRVQEHFHSLGIRTVFLQKHCPGEHHKFYAIRSRCSGEMLFFSFRKNTPDWIERVLREGLPDLMESIGLEIFGGDLIARPDGNVYLVDINAWPSFRGFQKDAARVIAEYCRELLG